MPRKITVKFISPGVQSDIYYLTNEHLSKLTNKDISNLSPLDYVEQNADKEFNISYGICLDHPNFKALIIEKEKEIEVGVQDLVDITEYGEELKTNLLTYNSDKLIFPCGREPAENHFAAIFVPVYYPYGSIECTIDVEDDFRHSDILINMRSLDLEGDFLHENIYLSNLHYTDNAEYEIIGITYNGKDYEFGQDLSFSGGSGSALLFKYDENDAFWYADYYTDIFEEN